MAKQVPEYSNNNIYLYYIYISNKRICNALFGHLMYSFRKLTQAPDTRRMILLRLLRVNAKPVAHRTHYFRVGNKPYKCQKLFFQGNWRPSIRVTLRNFSSGLNFPAESFQGRSSHPEVAKEYRGKIF